MTTSNQPNFGLQYVDEIPVLSTHYWVSERITLHAMDIPETRKTVIANINMLRDLAGESETALAKRLGWKQSTLNNMLSGRHNIAIERADAVAQAYGLEGWHLLLKDLPKDLAQSKTISKLFRDYMASSAEGRSHIDMVAEREAQYGK